MICKKLMPGRHKMFLKKKPEEKSYLFGMVKSINEQQRTLDIVASTSERDRHGDIVEPEAFTETIGSFLANSVILACHQHRLSDGSSPVIGSAKPETVNISKKDVTMTIRFATTELGEQYWSLYRDGHMKAFSIGFIPLEFIDEKDEKLGWIRTYSKIELLEVSAVPVPSNRRALAKVKELFGEGHGDDVDVKAVVSAATKELLGDIDSHLKEQLDNFAIRIEDSLDEIKSLLVPDSGRLAQEYLGNPDEQAALAKDQITAERRIELLEKTVKSFINGKGN